MTMTTSTSSDLIRAELWSADLKETLEDELMGMKYVEILDGFPDGNTFTMPSVGDVSVYDYVENTALEYNPLDTGEWQFTITEYLGTGTYVTRKNEQDSFYMSKLMSSFVPKQNRAIMEHFETTMLEKGDALLGTTTNGNYSINGTYHRFSGGNSGRIELADFAYALASLKKANVPQSNLVAIVDPSVEYTINTLSNLVDVSNNPRWEGIINDGIATGMKFVKNVYGFDVYTSNYLPDVTDNALKERDTSTTNDFSSTAGKANYFFSANGDILPWIAAWRQMPIVETMWDMDYQRTKYATTARYGVEIQRPENLISIVTNPTIV